MRVAFYNNRGKGDRIAAALLDAGHELDTYEGEVAVVDHPFHTLNLCDRHKVVVLYPHGGNPTLSWDGAAFQHPQVRLDLVHGVGQAQVMALYGYPVPCVPVGWCYSDLAAPRYPKNVQRVIFAPTHPFNNGRLNAGREDLHPRILQALLAAELDVTVRYWPTPESTGLPLDAPVDWQRGGTLDHEDIDAADLVVACETLAHLAVARGCPTIMFGSRLAPDLADDGGGFPARWDRYRDVLAYPYDFDDAPLNDLIRAVTTPDAAVEDWRARFVGLPFDARTTVRLIEQASEHVRTWP